MCVCVCVCVCVCGLAGMLAGHVECVKMLIEHGANVNASNDTGYVPLHVAVHNHHLLCIQGVSVSVGSQCCSFHSSSFVFGRPCMLSKGLRF
jgi:hypothetical protein